MSCQFADDLIEKTLDFHGHSCPGVAIGIRAAELAIKELGDPEKIQMVAVTETDMCGVDAIQYLTSCTYGKGNLLHRDLGKMAFNFFDRASGRGLRAVFVADAKQFMGEGMADLNAKVASGAATEADREQQSNVREAWGKQIMSLPLDELFTVSQPQMTLPRPPSILQSLVCEKCGEGVMESRTRRFQGKTLCIPCFASVEQKV